MIHEWRTYRLKAGAASEYLTLFADEGLPLVSRHLPLMGYWLGETGPLNTLYHLWSYVDWSEREACRASLATEEAWVKGFIPRAFALVEEQHNRFFTATATSPVFAEALSRRHMPLPARSEGAPLFAATCAGLVIGGAADDAVAVWDAVTGDRGGPVSLLQRSVDPVPHAGSIAGSHIILRPLAFSPL
jgi:NIPSNAP.